MGLRAAIDAMCKACLYDPIGGSGTWRAQVDACASYSCPLHPVRPRVRQAAEVRSEVQDGADLPAKLTILGAPALRISADNRKSADGGPDDTVLRRG